MMQKKITNMPVETNNVITVHNIIKTNIKNLPVINIVNVKCNNVLHIM